jgi:hypothetical protein
LFPFSLHRPRKKSRTRVNDFICCMYTLEEIIIIVCNSLKKNKQTRRENERFVINPLRWTNRAICSWNIPKFHLNRLKIIQCVFSNTPLCSKGKLRPLGVHPHIYTHTHSHTSKQLIHSHYLNARSDAYFTVNADD